jgi:hypothetical protein
MVVVLFPTCFVNRLGDGIDHEIRRSRVGVARTENPRVGGTIPPLATIRIKVLVKNDTDVSCPMFTGHSLRVSSSSIG